jgi:hypothetical protein
MLPPPLIDRLNELLEKLAYPPLTASWNAEPKTVKSASDDARSHLEYLMASMREGDWEFDVDSLAILADDDMDLRWVVEPRSATVRRGDGEVDIVITGAAEDLAQLVRGDANPGVLFRSGRIRPVSAADADEYRIDMPKMMTALVGRFAAAPNGGNGAGAKADLRAHG